MPPTPSVSARRLKVSGTAALLTWVITFALLVVAVLWVVPVVASVNELRESVDTLSDDSGRFDNRSDAAERAQAEADEELAVAVEEYSRAWAAFEVATQSALPWFDALTLYGTYERWASSGGSAPQPAFWDARVALRTLEEAEVDAADADRATLVANTVATAARGALASTTRELADAEDEMALRLSVAGIIGMLTFAATVVVNLQYRRQAAMTTLPTT